jgi:NSS family neurotransmitter:Na+ symporter
MKTRSDISLNAAMVAFGNNSVSLLAGIMVLCTVFALNPAASQQIVGAGNEGLTFVWMPKLFASMPAGGFFMVLFFLALSVAALTSLIAMVELAVRVLMDAGLSRRRALLAVACAGFALGMPSALSMDVFVNQDWVWGVGLLLSGLLFALVARRYGVEKLRTEVVNGEGCELPWGRWWTFVIAVLVPVEAVTLLVWWLWRARQSDPEGWLNPLRPATAGTLLLQWAVVLACIGLHALWRRRRASAAVGSAVGSAVAGGGGDQP